MNKSGSREEPRRELVNLLKLQLMGPELMSDCSEDKQIRIKDSIRDHFPVGVLYPLPKDQADQSEEDALAKIHSEESESGPQAMGLSFLVKSPSGPPGIAVQLQAGRFEKESPEDQFWTKKVLENEDSPFMEFQKPADNRLDQRVLKNRGELHLRWREEPNSLWHITVALSNAQVGDSLEDLTEKALFRTEIRCRALDDAIIEDYGMRESGRRSEDSDEWDVIYRDRKSYGSGHNTSADWSECSETGGIEVRTEFVPEAVIPDLTYQLEGACAEAARALDMKFLANGDRRDLYRCLGKFIDQHEFWIDKSSRAIDSICSGLKNISVAEDVCERILDRHRQVSARMNRSRELIAGELADDEVLKAFQLANQAMFDQLTQSLSLKGKASDSSPQWRPFQLAFQLLILQDLIDPEGEESHRDKVDLLWFPTGGGKTEAYLGIAAFEIFRRRLERGTEGAGVAVIKRYTLRALTFQQFERAGRMIAASELIRRSEPDLAEGPPITIGLWVGKKISPNTTSNDSEDVSKMGALEIFNQCDIGSMPFPSSLRRCCWCEKELCKTSSDQLQVFGNTLKISCSDSSCEFGGDSEIPVEFVDDSLYENPPSLLIGVIDKFAQLPLNPKTRAIFGAGKYLPPSVIIQDELHLIDGDLGSLAGGYEAAIDVICSRSTESGVRPKIIGATATISGASGQCQALYGRKQLTFPPPGLSIDDSFYMRVDENGPGRLYVGVMGTGASPTYTAVVANSSLIHGANEMAANRADEYDWEVLDGYLSLVTYHNTLRELSNTLTASMDHLPRNLELLGFSRALNTRELSSRTDSKEIASAMSEVSQTTGKSGCPEIDQLACSSIFGVGVDIPRLGLMSVMGQPKSTSDYIQATSRVGRGESPGLVVTLLNNTRTRDRSHYESFKGYHESIYRNVESTSVTPFSLGARNRSLAPAFVSVCRHESRSLAEGTASKLHCPEYANVLNELRGVFLQRCSEADPNEKSGVEEDLDQFLKEWKLLSKSGREEALRYYEFAIHRSESYVLVNRAEFMKRMRTDSVAFKKVLRVAPTSLRHVDTEISIRSKEARF